MSDEAAFLQAGTEFFRLASAFIGGCALFVMLGGIYSIFTRKNNAGNTKHCVCERVGDKCAGSQSKVT